MILRAFFLRFITKHPFRFLSTILGVAIGVGSVIAIILSCQAAIRAMEEDVEVIAGKTQFEITSPGGMKQTVLGDLRHIAKDAHITAVVDDLVFVPSLNDTVRILGVDLLTDQSFRDLEWNGDAGLQSESMIQVLRGEGVLVPQVLYDQLDNTDDSSINIIAKAKNYSLPITSTFNPANFSSSWDRVIVMDISMAQRILDRNGYVDRIEVVPRKGIEPEPLRQDITKAIPFTFTVGMPSDRSNQAGNMIRSLRFNLTALSGISLLVGAVLVAITLYTSVIQRKYTIALLLSLGASKRQIGLAVLAEACTIGLLGGIVGVVFGVLGSWAALSSVRSTIAAVVQGVPLSSIEIQPIMLVLGVILGLIVSLVSAYWALREALQTPPLQGLKTENPEAATAQSYVNNVVMGLACVIIAVVAVYIPPYNGLPVPALVSALFVLLTFVAISPIVVDLATALVHKTVGSVRSVILVLAASSLYAARERTALAASAICLSTALAIAMTIMISSFRQTINDWTEQATLSDIWIRPLATASGVPAGTLDTFLVDLAMKEFGKENVDPFYRSSVYIDGQKVSLGAGVFHPVRTLRGGVPFMDGRASKDVFQTAYENKAVIVNESFMRRFGYQRGDTVTMQVQDQIIERNIEGVFYDYSSHQGTIIMNRDDFLHYYPNESPLGIGIFVQENDSLQTVRDNFRQKIPSHYTLDIMLNRELRGEIMKVFERTFAITYALQLISSIVAGIAVLSILFALVNERKQDLALLQSIGATNTQVTLLVICKALMMGVTGLTGGITAGYFVGVILVDVVNLQSFNWTLRFAIPWLDIMLMTLLVLISCCIAAIAPALTVSKNRIQEVLRATE